MAIYTIKAIHRWPSTQINLFIDLYLLPTPINQNYLSAFYASTMGVSIACGILKVSLVAGLGGSILWLDLRRLLLVYFRAPSLVPPGYRVLDFMTKDFPLPVNDFQRSFFFWSRVSLPEGVESFLILLVP